MAAKKSKIQIKTINKHTVSFKYGRFEWLNITKPSHSATSYLEENFKIVPTDLKDTLPYLRRNKIVDRKNYTFLILIFPYRLARSRHIRPSEVDFIIMHNRLITVHKNELSPLKEVVKEIEDKSLGPEYFTPERLLEHILNHLYEYCIPLSNGIGNSLDKIEEVIFQASLADQKIVQKIFNIERQVVDFRKIMRGHEMIMDRMTGHLPAAGKAAGPHDLMPQLSDMPRSIWTRLESHMEAVSALRGAYESITSFHLNDIIKTLTIISVIIAPMTLAAGIFGMNFKIIPFGAHPFGFIYAILFMLALSLLAYLFFKWKKWL